jgi:hypothetical protein
MKKFALLGAAALMLTAGPALAQAGGGATPAPPNAGSAGGGGAADRLGIPDRDQGANAQQMMDRQGELNHGFVKGGKKAEAYRARLQEFSAQSAGRRSQAMSLRQDALAGNPIPVSSTEIRAQLQQDMEDWRKAFKIDKAQFEGLRDQIVVEADALTPAQWADRRAQWFELRDEWIAQEMASTQGG